MADYFGTQRSYHLENPIASHRAVTYLYLRCRKEGVTVRYTVNYLIARLAIENGLTLLHNDRDLSHMSRVIPGLHLA